MVRDVNILINELPTLNLPETDKKNLEGETAFIRAYAYFALAKRYGGVPLITTKQEYEGDIEKLKVPRNTEKETWDFVLQECDKAAENLPDAWPNGERRATKWAAYALKSRAALFAASVAKYWNNAPLSGEAVTKKLVGLDIADANGYYQACINASKSIMESGKFGLYKPNPANIDEAAENYKALFEDPVESEEAIFVRAFVQIGVQTAHNYDVMYNPNQTSNGFPHPGRLNPTLDLVDAYESYANPGYSAPVVTTVDGNVNDYSGYSPTKNYLRFDHPYEVFFGKDIRLWSTVILPGTNWKGTDIVIQDGFVKPDGTAVTGVRSSITLNGKTYYTFGAADWTQYSGFDREGGDGGVMTRSGFGFKKLLTRGYTQPTFNAGLTDWIDFRYAEVLLNYAEAVVETRYIVDNAQQTALKALNDIRRRAGHTQDIPLTLDNVLRERRVELAFENKRYWDLIRRREFHTEFNGSVRHALLPLLDLRVDPPKYIFVRTEIPLGDPLYFLPKNYYRPIPETTSNGLIQNPQY